MKILQKISILSISFIILMAGAVTVPIVHHIAKAFPDMDMTYIKMVVTLPSLLLIPSSLYSNQIANKIGKKHTILLGCLIYLIAGIASIFAPSLFVLLFLRGLVGVGVGFIVPLSVSIIADFYEQQEQKTMVGLAAASNNIGIVVALAFASMVGSIMWRYAFVIYVMVFVSLCLVYFFVPNPKISHLPLNNQHRSENQITTVNPIVYFVIFSVFMVSIIYFAIPTTLALYLTEKNLIPNNMIGFLIAIVPITGFITGCFYSRIETLLKDSSGVLIFSLCFIAFFLISIFSQILIIIAALILLGISVGYAVPYFNQQIMNTVPKNTLTTVLSFSFTLYFLGQFFSTFVADIFIKLIHLNHSTGAFIVSSVLAFIMVLLQIFLLIYLRHKNNIKYNY